MSEASQARLEAFQALLLSDGEPLSLMDGRKLVIRANGIVRRAELSALDGPEQQYTERNATTIEVLQEDATPKHGQAFVDANSMGHRIQNVRRTDNTWFCECLASEWK